MTFRIAGCTIHLHPILPFLWGFGAVTGIGERVMPMLLALAVHECGHLLAAYALGLRVTEIEITPLGGVFSMDRWESAAPIRRFLMAFAGPAVSIACCLLAPFLYQRGIGSFDSIGAFIHASMLLALLNLIPAYPLDGARMLEALLEKWTPGKKAAHGAKMLSYVLGLALCALTVIFAFQGKVVLAPAFAGLYLLYAAMLNARQRTARYVTHLIARRQRLEKNTILPVESVAAGEGTITKMLLRQIKPGKYHIIHVLSSDGLSCLGTVYEKDFCESVLREGQETFGELLCRKKDAFLSLPS